MKKLVRTMLIIGIATIGGVFADDCDILVNKKESITIDKKIESIVKTYDQKYLNVLPIEAFSWALINLKAYCCRQAFQKYCSSDDEKNLSLYYPKSAFFFDHLLDVALRRLDGIKSLTYNISPDPTALERRTKITEIANNANGVQANEIESLYTKYRTLHKYPIDSIITKYNKDITTISLGDKYDTICELVREIYNKTTNWETIIGQITETNSFFNGCKKLVKERVKRETGYIRILMVQKSNQLFDTTTKAYTKKYFVQEKMMALWDLIAKVKDIFQTIVQQAPVSKTCSK